MESRILAVADVVESMASTVPIVPPWALRQPLRRLKRIKEPLRQCCRRCLYEIISGEGLSTGKNMIFKANVLNRKNL